ncbi:MAG: hypothetical protein V1816_17660 [Pseudomonadota bacterium]
MMDDPAAGSAPILDALDEVLNAAYFTPLAVGDALAIQFRVESLRGIPAETAAGVFALMDGLEAPPDQDGRPDLAGAAADFFSRLSREFPEVYEKWSSDPGILRLDPEAAFQIARSRAEDKISRWLKIFFPEISSDAVERTRAEAVNGIMSEYDPAARPNDLALRAWLRDERLPAWPSWARPGIYLDCWSDFVQAVLDPSPSAKVITRRLF